MLYITSCFLFILNKHQQGASVLCVITTNFRCNAILKIWELLGKRVWWKQDQQDGKSAISEWWTRLTHIHYIQNNQLPCLCHGCSLAGAPHEWVALSSSMKKHHSDVGSTISVMTAIFSITEAMLSALGFLKKLFPLLNPFDISRWPYNWASYLVWVGTSVYPALSWAWEKEHSQKVIWLKD